MILESTGNMIPENVTNAISVVNALAPAFAIGFAVQRFIEILDSWFDLDKKLSAEWKNAIMSTTALIVGISLASLLKIKVLETLGIEISQNLFWIEWLVSGLIISAGTDGLNSILKFLSYSKEVKKAEVETEENAVISSRGMNRMSVTSFASFVNNGFSNTGDLDADLETSLKDQIRFTWKKQFNEAEWKSTEFKKYTDIPDDPKIVVRDATIAVAESYNRHLTKETRIRLQSQVTLDSSPESVLPNMKTAVLFGSTISV
jgi:hypothetical protein